MQAALRKNGMLTAGMISAGITALGALALAFFLIVSVGGGPEFLLVLLWIGVTVPVPWLCLSLLGRVRDAEVALGEDAPQRWQGLALLLLASSVWLFVNWAVFWVVRGGFGGHASRGVGLGDVGLFAVFTLLPLPTLAALGNFCLLGRPVPPGGNIYDAAG